MTLFTGSSRVAEKLAADLQGRIKLEDAGFDWKILGPDVQEVWSHFCFILNINIFIITLYIHSSVSCIYQAEDDLTCFYDMMPKQVDYISWVCDQDAYACSGQKCSAQSMLFMHKVKTKEWYHQCTIFLPGFVSELWAQLLISLWTLVQVQPSLVIVIFVILR